MESWISAIQNRVKKYASPISSTSSSPAILSPKTPHQSETQTTTRVTSTYSILNNTSPEFYRVATLPLRCTNLTFNDEEKETLLHRRNKKLAPIVTHQKSESPQLPSASYSTTSSLTPSPTGAVLGPLISPGIIGRYSQYNNQNNHPLPMMTKGVCYQQQIKEEECSSPTYLMYKKKFHL